MPDRDAEFAGGPVCGSVAPNAKLADGSLLLDRAGIGMTAILFCNGRAVCANRRRCSTSSARSTTLCCTRRSDHRLTSRRNAIPDTDGEIARLFAAAPGTLYLLRPDLHIAGRWKTIVPTKSCGPPPLPRESETP